MTMFMLLRILLRILYKSSLGIYTGVFNTEQFPFILLVLPRSPHKQACLALKPKRYKRLVPHFNHVHALARSVDT